MMRLMHPATARVRDLYVRFPYPPPAIASASNFALFGQMEYVRYVLWPGRRDLAGLRVLDAGCGTGATAVEIASKYPDIHVTGIDLSTSSLDVARRLAKTRGVRKNLELHQLPIEDVGSLGQSFDYVISSGVLHHLADPDFGLRQLASVLNPRGGMAIMLYATHGRHAVYLMQDLLRRLVGHADLATQTLVARRMLDQLPAWHPFKPADWSDLGWSGDSGLVDLLLHVQDRPYTVPQVYDFLTQANLKLQRFFAPNEYEPATYAADPQIAASYTGLDTPSRNAIAELLHGQMTKHMFFATHKTYQPMSFEARGTLMLAQRPTRSPLFRWDLAQGGQLAEVGYGQRLGRTLQLEPWSWTILNTCDGQRTAADIFQLPRVQSALPGADIDERFQNFGAFMELMAQQEVLLFEP
jgi:SAM-dependent methyltransferase